MRKEGLRKLYADSKSVFLLLALCTVAAFFCAVAFAVGGVLVFLSGGASSLLKYLFFTGLPFLAVSVLRRIINAPRPFETFGIEPPFSQKRGNAFPSRHAFSAFLIGTVLCFVSPLLGAVVLLVGIGIAWFRYALGCHSALDLFVGGVLGIASGVIGGLLL